MKALKIIWSTSVLLMLFSCQKEVVLDLETAKPRLVINAVMERNITDNGYEYNTYVRLTKTSSYYKENIPFVENAQVSITDENGHEYEFSYQKAGFYFPASPIKIKANINYTLKVEYKNQIYTAIQDLAETEPLLYVEQNNDGGITNENIELKVFFNDPPDEPNFYLYASYTNSDDAISYSVLNDESFDGNQFFIYYSSKKLEPGESVRFRLMGIDRDSYNYHFALLQQIVGSGRGPFSTQPATVKGNIINATQVDKYPYGYFRISEVSILEYTIQ